MHRSMRLLFILALLTSCASIPAGSGSVELRPAGNKTFLWQGRTLSIQDLTAELSARDQVLPIERINLLDGETSTTIADVVDVAILAKSLGASPFVEKDGKLQPITLEITE